MGSVSRGKPPLPLAARLNPPLPVAAKLERGVRKRRRGSEFVGGIGSFVVVVELESENIQEEGTGGGGKSNNNDDDANVQQLREDKGEAVAEREQKEKDEN